MSVLFREIDKPNNCYECPLCDDKCFGAYRCRYVKGWGSENSVAPDCIAMSVESLPSYHADESNPRHITVFITSLGNLVDVGYIELREDEKFDAEDCWDLCNWAHWATGRPENLHSPISSCSHGVCFYDSTDDTYHLALSRGFLVGSFETVMKYITEHDKPTYWERPTKPDMEDAT